MCLAAAKLIKPHFGRHLLDGEMPIVVHAENGFIIIQKQQDMRISRIFLRQYAPEIFRNSNIDELYRNTIESHDEVSVHYHSCAGRTDGLVVSEKRYRRYT